MVRARALITGGLVAVTLAGCVNTVSDITSKPAALTLESTRGVDELAACLSMIRIGASPSVVPMDGGKRVVFSNSDGIPLVFDLHEGPGGTRVEMRRQSSIVGQSDAAKACAAQR